jgi:hypothetical protein
MLPNRFDAAMAEHSRLNKSARAFAKPLRESVGKLIGKSFQERGFASAELVTRWAEIAGAEIAAHSEPLKIQWTRPPRAPSAGGGAMEGGQEPGTLVLRVEGPAAIEIQHAADVICARVNRFLGWRAVARLALRQAPLRRGESKSVRVLDPDATARMAASLPEIADEDLRQALARLGAAVRRR